MYDEKIKRVEEEARLKTSDIVDVIFDRVKRDALSCPQCTDRLSKDGKCPGCGWVQG